MDPNCKVWCVCVHVHTNTHTHTLALTCTHKHTRPAPEASFGEEILFHLCSCTLWSLPCHDRTVPLSLSTWAMTADLPHNISPFQKITFFYSFHIYLEISIFLSIYKFSLFGH